ncbi:RNA recognition motif domain containing protein [Babesia bovis T2Bo]|uniref:RNA recognition motif domain containing protein n=1 Tax=Babesia bovis T2Bo TaxID=484906 RepID=UPI001D2F0C92|nr:RNA recognition motif domain containing protein [Babesia bovis T2Bo]EDO06993.2 RNA recognition motif domain containing protein [Babesia bovis T2Bo]
MLNMGILSCSYALLIFVYYYPSICYVTQKVITTPTTQLRRGLFAQFKTKTGKRPHGISRMRDIRRSHVQELTYERVKLSKDHVLTDAKILFINNVDPEITQDAIDYLLHYIHGPLTTSTKLFKDKYTQRHKGYGYIKFSTPEIATRTLLSLNGARIGNRQIILSEYLPKSSKSNKLDPVISAARRIIQKVHGGKHKTSVVDKYDIAFLPINEE